LVEQPDRLIIHAPADCHLCGSPLAESEVAHTERRRNAHILRELNYVIETSKPQWAEGMKTLLLGIKAEVDKAREDGRKRLPPRRMKEFLRKYDEAIEKAKNLYGTLKRKRGRVKKPIVVESPICRLTVTRTK
jgi:hypothetical protein